MMQFLLFKFIISSYHSSYKIAISLSIFSVLNVILTMFLQFLAANRANYFMFTENSKQTNFAQCFIRLGCKYSIIAQKLVNNILILMDSKELNQPFLKYYHNVNM